MTADFPPKACLLEPLPAYLEYPPHEMSVRARPVSYTHLTLPTSDLV